MGCAASTVSPREQSTRTGGVAVPSRDEDPKQREYRLKAEASAARLAAVMAEIEEEKAAEQAQFVNTSDASLITALQRLYYGTTIPIERQQYQPFLRATMCVAAADGVNDTEAQWMKDRLMLLGVTEERINSLFQTDFRLQSVAPLLASFTEASSAHEKNMKPLNGDSSNCNFSLQRVILYDALTMASIDTYTLDERARATEVSELLCLSDKEAEEIKAIVSAEEELRNRKRVLFSVEDGAESQQEPPNVFFSFFAMDSEDPKKLDDQDIALRPRREALHRLVYGTNIPLIAVEYRFDQYVDLLLSVAGVENVVTEAGKVRLPSPFNPALLCRVTTFARQPDPHPYSHRSSAPPAVHMCSYGWRTVARCLDSRSALRLS